MVTGAPVRWFKPSTHSETICKEILGLLPPATSSLDKDSSLLFSSTCFLCFHYT